MLLLRVRYQCLLRTYSLLRNNYVIAELVPTSEANLTRSLMYMFDMMMSSAVEDEKAARENKNLRVWMTVSTFL